MSTGVALFVIGVIGVMATVWVSAFVMDKLTEWSWYYGPLMFTWVVIGVAFFITGATGAVMEHEAHQAEQRIKFEAQSSE